MYKFGFSFLFIMCVFIADMKSQIINVGSGSYTTSFPGKDSAGRNDFPSGSPQVSGNAMGRPVPTNDWWSKLIKENHADNLFNYPLSMKTVNEGLVVSDIVPVSTPNGSSQPFNDALPIIVGVAGLNASKATVSDYSDWTVSMNWNQNTHDFTATAGIGMPFLYFTKNSSDVAQVIIAEGNVVMDNESLIISNSHQGANYAIYAPAGSTWSQSGSTYTSDLNGKDYWSMVKLPNGINDIPAIAELYKKYAYVFPSNTTATWDFNENTSVLTTTFSVATDVKEGTNSNVILGLLPHQWGHLSMDSPQPIDYSYTTIRGELKVLESNSFTVEHTFKGILPTLPYLDNYSPGFDPSELNEKIAQIENDGLATWTDSYNEGQVMNRLIQTARIADEMGNVIARDKVVKTIKERLEDWLKAESGEVAFIYFYNTAWSALIGYPAGHGQDSNLNDHHFHWGYFIHAAAFMEQFEPGWSEEWGGMIDLLIRDAASPNRNDDQFPYLRNFSPYAGHSWANGFATFPFGNDQESTSESMQFASSLIHWGSVTQNNAIRDLGIYIYTTEQSATEEYWFDMNKRTFKEGYGYQLASRIWGNGYDNQTFWTSDISAAYGIELYPIHGGSLYLGHNQAYVQSLWDEISVNTGILSNEENPNLWHDTYWKYLAFIDPSAAIELYDSNPNRDLKFGIADAQTYHWLHAMNVLGTVNTDITANHPIAASFTNNGDVIYVAHNYSDEAITVTFSDGYELFVPAHELVTSRDLSISGTLTSDFQYAYPGGSVNLNVGIIGNGATKVEFYDGSSLIGEDTSEPYQIKAENLALGIHNMYAKIYVNDEFNNTNIISIQVGEQRPYTNIFSIPGTIESANYDEFEGGRGQNISYLDLSLNNIGDYRVEEYVDAENNDQEGPYIGWIDSGEWLEYSIDVETAGYYNMDFRYASGNPTGGGPFHFEIDGMVVSEEIAMGTTNGWGLWQTRTLNNIELTQGKHILRLVVTNGEFNLGRMNFTFSAPLDFVPPIANAGNNLTVVLPDDSAMLDGSLSNDPEGESITFNWNQIFGPSLVVFDDNFSSQPTISNLVEGVYKCELTVSDGTYTSRDDVLIIVSSDGNLPPTISIASPENNKTFKEGESIEITTTSADVDGFVELVEFFDGTTKIGEDASLPFGIEWSTASVGSHEITAVATDNLGAQGSSQAIIINVAEVRSCTETSNVAQQGSFSTGYEVTFETVGSNVTATFTLLDTDKVGVVAYLWQQSPFTEYEMSNTSGLTFTKTFGGQTEGASLTYACKFAFAGGLAVTKYFTYKVGNDCTPTQVDDVNFYQIDIVPNPTSDVLHVRGLPGAVFATIYSSLGQRLQTNHIIDQLDVSHLPKGVYYVRFLIGKSAVTKKFVKG
jgi:endoglucanase Acf2